MEIFSCMQLLDNMLWNLICRWFDWFCALSFSFLIIWIAKDGFGFETRLNVFGANWCFLEREHRSIVRLDFVFSCLSYVKVLINQDFWSYWKYLFSKYNTYFMYLFYCFLNERYTLNNSIHFCCKYYDISSSYRYR